MYYKFKKLLTLSEQRQAKLLLCMMFVGMLLETAGLGLVIPFLAILTDENIVEHYPVLKPMFIFFNYPSQAQLVIGGILCLGGTYFIKTVFLIFMTWKQNKFIFAVQANLSSRLFVGYLKQSWAFHLKRNSAQLILNATNEVGVFATSTLQSGMVLLTEGLILLGIGVLLLLAEPIGALSVLGALGVILYISQRGIRKKVIAWGKVRQEHDGYRVQHLQQGLGGAKEVKLLGREHDFIKQYNEHAVGSAKIGEKLRTLIELPRLCLEFLAVLALVGIVLIMFARGKQITLLIPTIGIFAAAAFRLLPSLNRVLGAIQNLRYSWPVVDTLYNEIISITTDVTKPVQNKNQCIFKEKIKFEGVSYKYAASDRNVMDKIFLSIPRGSSVGFIGTSGAGKSTLIDVLLGLLVPSAGTVYVDGVDIQINLRGWQDQIGYVSQTIFLTDDTLRRNVAFGLADEAIDDNAVRKAIEEAQLETFVDGLDEGLNTFVGERGVRLSGGQRQRIGIARALYHDPEILVLDEATSALDSSTEQEVMKAINALQGKKTLILVAHRMSTIKRCDWVYKMDHGKIVNEGSPESVIYADANQRSEKNEKLDISIASE